jgi:hypothetical protein
MFLEDSRHFIANKAAQASPYIFKTVIGALLLLLLMPLWVVTYLPFGDLPDHASQINTILNGDRITDKYQVNWFTPYLFTYGLTIVLSQIFGVVYAIKVILSVTVLAFPFVTYKIVKELDGDVRWALPSIVVGYSFVLFWGFYSFTVSSVIGMFFILTAIRYSRRPFSWTAYALFALFSLFLFFSHALAWAFVVSFSCLVVFCFNNLKETIKKASAFFIVVPIVALWASGTPGQSTVEVESGRHLEHLFNKFSSLVTYIVNDFNERTEQGIHTVRLGQFFSFAIGKNHYSDYVAMGAFLAFAPLLYGAKITRQWKRWLPSIFTFSAFMIVPYWLFDTAYINERFSLFCFLSLLFAYEKRAVSPGIDGFFNKQNLFVCLTAAVVFAVLYNHLQTLVGFKENERDFKKILSRMEENKRVMSLIYDNEPSLPFAPPFQHYGKWYAAVKPGQVNYSFSIDPSMWHFVPLRYKGEPRPILDPWNPNSFNWHHHKGEIYDYFLVRSLSRVDHVFADSGNSIVLIAQEGKWFLYGKSGLLNKSEELP